MKRTRTRKKRKDASTAPAFEPRVVAFCCNWCSYAGADLAGVSRLALPPNFHVVRVMCSARVAPEWVLKALADGIDGVMVLGCHLGDCHYIDGNHRTAKRFALVAEMLDIVGLGRERMALDWVSASEGAKFQSVVSSFVERVRELGPVRAAGASTSPPALGRRREGGDAPPPAAAVVEGVRERVADLLRTCQVDGVVGLRLDGGLGLPHVFREAEEVAGLVLEPRWPLATFCQSELQASEAGRLALVATAADERAVVEMAKLGQVDLGRIEVVRFSGGEHAPDDDLARDLAALGQDERRAFWERELQRCIKCYGCRNACPVCLCDACVLEEGCWVEAGRIPPSLPFHWIRAWHVADRCVLCGACEAACPAEIPLLALHHQIHGKLGELFDYAPGRDVAEKTPLITSWEENPLREL